VPLAELRTRIPRKLFPLVEEFKNNVEKLRGDQGGRVTLEKSDDPTDIRSALQAAAASMNKRVRFPFRGEEGAVSGQTPQGPRFGGVGVHHMRLERREKSNDRA